MLATNKFKTARIFKIISGNDKGGVSYAAQYHCDNKMSLEQYLNHFAAKLTNTPRYLNNNVFI